MASFCHLEEGGKQDFFWFVFCLCLQSLPRAVSDACNSWYFTYQKFTNFWTNPQPSAECPFQHSSEPATVFALRKSVYSGEMVSEHWCVSNTGSEARCLFAFIVFQCLLWVQNVYVTLSSLKIGNHAAVKLPCVDAHLSFPICGHLLFFPSRGVCACIYAVCIFLLYILCINMHVYTYRCT